MEAKIGKKSTKTSTTNAPPSWAVPVLQGAGSGILDTFNQNQGNLSQLSGNLSGMLPGLQQQIGDTKQQLQPGIGYAQDVLGGQYLNSNPYTQAMAQRAGQDAGNAVNSTFSLAGRTGSGNHATDLARGVDQAENSVMFQNYQNERANQNQAAGMLPGLTSAQYAGYTPYFAGTQLAGQLPYYGSNSLGNIGGLYGGYGTQTGKQPGGWGTDLLNAAVSGATMAAMASDRRLKTNIVRIGEWDDRGDGLGKYAWNWKSHPDGEKVVGVIADEVKELRPAAYIENYRNGYDGVNYAALGVA